MLRAAANDANPDIYPSNAEIIEILHGLNDPLPQPAPTADVVTTPAPETVEEIEPVTGILPHLGPVEAAAVVAMDAAVHDLERICDEIGMIDIERRQAEVRWARRRLTVTVVPRTDEEAELVGMMAIHSGKIPPAVFARLALILRLHLPR